MTQAYASFIFCAPLVFVSACGGQIGQDAPGAEATEPPSYDVVHDPLAQRLADALVEYRNRCRLVDDWVFEGDRNAVNRRDILADRYDIVLASPNVSADVDAWTERCASALETAACRHVVEPTLDDLFVSYGTYLDLYAPLECSTKPAGRMTSGEACLDDLECAESNCLFGTGSCGICAPRESQMPEPTRDVALGEPCDAGHHCNEEGFCGDVAGERRCKKRYELGELCELSVGSCAEGLACERFPLGTQPETRRCIVPSTTLATRGILDAACNLQNPCHSELFCREGTCTTPPGLGETCQGLTQGCAAGLTCASTSAIPGPSTFTCTRRPGAGEPCLGNLQGSCGPGLLCANDDVCQPASTESCR